MAKEWRDDVSAARESESSTSTAAANHHVEAEVASQDKQCQKSIKYHYYDANVHTKIAKSACEKTTYAKLKTSNGCYTQNANYLDR